MRSTCFERHEYLVSLSMDFLIALRPSHAIVVVLSEMLCLG